MSSWLRFGVIVVVMVTFVVMVMVMVTGISMALAGLISGHGSSEGQGDAAAYQAS